MLDGSTDDHAEWNKKNTEQSDRISYIKFDSDISFLDRVLNFLESCPADELMELMRMFFSHLIFPTLKSF